MPYQSFESLEVWKRSCRLAIRVYSALENCRDYGLKDQMTRAAVSVASNIAEGYERGTVRDFARYLKIAQGSAAELRTQAYIARSAGLAPSDEMRHISQECKAIGAMLQSLSRVRTNSVGESEIENGATGFEPPETGNPKPETE